MNLYTWLISILAGMGVVYKGWTYWIDGEVKKAKENSVGAEAIAKISKEIADIKSEQQAQAQLQFRLGEAGKMRDEQIKVIYEDYREMVRLLRKNLYPGSE